MSVCKVGIVYITNIRCKQALYVHKPYEVEISVGGRSENIGVHVVARTPNTSHSEYVATSTE